VEGASPKIFSNAKDLRDKATKAEEIMELRNNKLEGYKFRRQHPLNIIADFIVIN
jgi:very-short-patch-repair endonuclease